MTPRPTPAVRTPAEPETPSRGADEGWRDPLPPALRLRWLTSAQAAEYCQVCLKTFNRMVQGIPIPFARPAGPNGDRRFFRVDIDRALLSCRENLEGAQTVKGSAS